MNLVSFILTAVAMFTGPTSMPPAPAEDLPKVTLAEALASVDNRAALLAQVEVSTAVHQKAQTLWNQAYLPGVASRLGVKRTHERQELETPFGAFPQGSQTVKFFEMGLRQPILNIAQRRYQVPAARLQSEAQVSKAYRTREILAFEAVTAFTQVLRLEAQLKATRKFMESLEKRVEQVQTQVEHGRALKSDLLKINLRRDDTRLDEIRLLDLWDVATWNLGRAIGLEHAVAPDWQASEGEPWGNAPKGGDEKQTAQRADLLAIQQQSEALGLQAQGIRAERLPNLDGDLRYFHLRESPFTRDGFFEAELALSWKVFAAGTRKTRAAAVRAQRRALDLQLREQQRLAEMETRQALAGWRTAIEALRIRKQGVIQAEETARVEGIRYDQGRITVNDWLDAQAVLRQRQSLLDVAYLDLVDLRYQYLLAKGERLSESPGQ